MNDSLFFATFDPLYVNAPDACNLCIAQPPAFSSIHARYPDPMSG